MSLASALAIVSVVLVSAFDAGAASPEAGGAGSVANASKILGTARANLAKAVQRIEMDPPSTEDLDAAHSAVGALKDALDAGAEYEGKDLDFARAVMAARKELRTQREYVDQRRAKVHIFNHRRAIDGLATTLTERARSLEAKEPSPKDFDDARAAAAALEKAVEVARPFAKEDQTFATYIAEVEASVARHQKAMDDRSTRLAADRQRVLVQESRDALTAAMAPLGKGASDAQFQTADRAAALLSKGLAEGAPLEAKDKTYRSEAEMAKTLFTQSKKRMDELWSETGLARLKAEIEPAHRDLVAAGRGLRAKDATAEQVAEARTAAIVVGKLIETFEPEASRSQAFGQYVAEVKKTLGEVQGELERRSLASARKDLASAIRNLERRAPTDEHFAEANTALVVLEKTLETVHAKDPAMIQPVLDVKAVIRDSRATITKRRFEVDLDRHRAKVGEAKRNAGAIVAKLQQPSIEKEQLLEAENAVKQLGAALSEGAAFTRKDRDYAQYEREVKERIVDLNGRIANRRIVLAASDGRAVLDDTIAKAKTKLEAASQPEATDADLEAASKGVEALTEAIEARTALEKQDKGYAAQAQKARNELTRETGALELAKQVRLLRRKTVEALALGAKAADSAPAASELRAQKELHEKARALFKACESAGSSMIEENRALGKVTVIVDGHPSTSKEVIALCAQRSKATEQLLGPVLVLIGFDEGPKRAYEAGRGLLAKDNKSEALKQFYECISSGRILLNRNPDLKDRKFPVAGASMSLPEVIQSCITQRDALGSVGASPP